MTTFYCADDNKKWKSLDDSVDLKDFAYKHLRDQAGLDSYSGYYAFYEFWRDGVRTYGYAEYDCWDKDYDMEGDMNAFAYGSLEEVKKRFGDDGMFLNRLTPNPFDPARDYINLSSYDMKQNARKWPPKS